MYVLGHLKIEHVAILVRTQYLYTAEIIPGATWQACQKCKKSKTAGLGCLRVATVAILEHPPNKVAVEGG